MKNTEAGFRSIGFVVQSNKVVMVTTAHTNVDYALVQRSAQAVLDTKNAMKSVEPRENIEVL